MKVECKKCGFNDFPNTEKSNIHIKATCKNCNSFIKFLPQNKNEIDFVFYFGKYKGRNASSLIGTNAEEFNYLKWLLNQDFIKLKNNQIEILKKLTS